MLYLFWIRKNSYSKSSFVMATIIAFWFICRFIYTSLSDSIDDFHYDSSYPVKQSIHSPTTIKRLQHMQHRYIQHNHNQSFPIVNDVNTHRSVSSTISASPTNVIRRKRVMRILEDLHSKQREINGKNRLKYRKYPEDNIDGRRKLTKTVSGRTLLELQIPTAQGNANDIYCSNSYGSILHSK